MSRQLATILEKAGLLPEEDIATALDQARQSKRSLWDIVLTEINLPEEKLAEALSEHLRVPYVRLAAAIIDPDAVRLVSEELARRFQCLPLKLEGEETETTLHGPKRRRTLVLAMGDPTNFDAIQDIEFATGCVIKPVVATRTEIADAIGRYYAPENWLQEFLQNVNQNEELQIVSLEGDEDKEIPLGDARSQAQLPPVVKMVNLIIQDGIKLGASDIHIEPRLNDVQVRTRVDGLLREFMHVPKWLQGPLISRLKILAKLDIAERRLPQDGRIKVALENRGVDLRVSTLPTHFGEKAVLRVLGTGGRVPPTASLGLKEHEMDLLKAAVDQPQGMILVTGPTSSGKTTTLYSLINEKKNPAINIITVEDPIEIQLPGISQVQVNNRAGFTFASSLRSILRQDPDVILVGEIRDLETAEIAFHAAMTGHLVLSTLHTNSTVATVARLLDLGVDPYLISSSVNLIVAQRLVRKICDRCREEYAPPRKLLERLHLEEADLTFFHGRGCDACGKTGHVGRIGVFELLRMTPTLKELINRKASETELRKAALSAGTTLLLQEAMEKVNQGMTTIEELLRVIQLQEDEVIRCPNCSNFINLDFSACPYCLFTLKVICEACRQELKPEWRICPYCSARITKITVEGQSERPTPFSHPATIEKTDQIAVGNGGNGRDSAGNGGAPARTPRILVMDDDDPTRRMIVRSLEQLPSQPEVLAAVDGFEGLAAVENVNPDLVVLDVTMPGMDGFEVCQKLRSKVQTAFIPILMLTGNTDEASRTRGFLVGTDDYMGKPFSVPELHARINRLLRRTYGL